MLEKKLLNLLIISSGYLSGMYGCFAYLLSGLYEYSTTVTRPNLRANSE